MGGSGNNDNIFNNDHYRSHNNNHIFNNDHCRSSNDHNNIAARR